MGTISISLPIKANGTFRIKDPKSAKKLVKEIEELGERISPIDELFGIWADRSEKESDLVKEIRDRNNRRDG